MGKVGSVGTVSIQKKGLLINDGKGVLGIKQLGLGTL